MDVFVEAGVGGHIDDAVQAWVFDVRFWGRCGQGDTEASALKALARQLDLRPHHLVVSERVHGDEQAFVRDREPARDTERDRTKTILRAVRSRTTNILEGCTDAQLDWVDPGRRLPAWATWETLRAMGWHVLDTESRYYLGQLGVEPPRASEDLFEELRQSVARTAICIDELPADLVVEVDGQVWTTTKVLRRLAWHERAELETIEAVAVRASAALQ